MENLKTLENSVMKILEIDNSYLIENSIISSQNYISNLGNASENLLKFLSNLKNSA